MLSSARHVQVPDPTSSAARHPRQSLRGLVFNLQPTLLNRHCYKCRRLDFFKHKEQEMATATALRRPEIKTELPGPKARAIIEADDRLVNPAYPRPDFKLVAERGEGVWVTDVDGNIFLDC